MTTEHAEDLAFEQGFNSIHADPAQPTEAAPAATEEAPEPAAPATAPEAVAQPEKKTEPEPDPFASLPPAVRDLLAAIPVLRADLESTKRIANMVPALQSRIDKLSQPAPATAPEAVAPGKSKFAKVEAIRAELPEIADALDEIAADRQRAQEPPPAAPQPSQPQATSNPHEEALTAVRPSWANDLISSDFQLWLARQDQQFQTMVHRTNNAKDILDALGRFDAFRQQTTSTQQTTQARASRMAAGVIPTGNVRRAPPAPSQDDEEDAAFTAAFNTARGRP